MSDYDVPRAPYSYDDDSVGVIQAGRFDFKTLQLIDIRDIARSLGAQVRYNGHTHEPYSIAQHSVACARLVRCWGESKLTQLTALIHDAAEAYCSDIPKPLRRRMRNEGGVYDEILEEVEEMIAEKYGLPYPYPQAVEDADAAVYAYERQGISKHPYIDISEVEDPPALVGKTLASYWNAQRARKEFMEEFVLLS